MSECQRCGGRAQMFLCKQCTTTLRTTLADMPWWLSRLTEAAIGQTRMSDNAGRKSAPRRDLDGDRELAACIELLPNDDDLDKARRKRQQHALAHALATGGINARASELLAEIADSLAYWCRVLSEHRGLPYTPPRSRSALGANHALWLRANVAAIAASEEADDIAGDIQGHHDDIVRIVNRPIHTIHLGECPTWDDNASATCGYTLRAPQDAVEVYCRRCNTTHNCNRLLLALMDAAEREVKPWDELVRINRGLPAEYRVAPRTLQHWRTTGMLRPHQWVRPDGRKGITRHSDDDVPLYSWADVKRLQLRKPQKITTGAAAHRGQP